MIRNACLNVAPFFSKPRASGDDPASTEFDDAVHRKPRASGDDPVKTNLDLLVEE